MTKYTDKKNYDRLFFDGCRSRKEKALECALDIRKFEIELYWKRAMYFWAFIAFTFTSYFFIQKEGFSSNKQDLEVILSCLGCVLSFAWILVNHSSKLWQENWECHVDLLEDDVTGPLYKTFIRKKDGKYKDFHPSVSQINQYIGIYFLLIWIYLLNRSLKSFNFFQQLNCFYIIIVAISIFFCILFCKKGFDKKSKYEIIFNTRDVK